MFGTGPAIYDTYQFIKDPSWSNAGYLALDVASAAIPFVPSGSSGSSAIWATSKAASKADDVSDAVSSVVKRTSNSTESPALIGSPYHPDSVAARIKPEYRANPAHDKGSSSYNPRKTPEPSNAQSVYENSLQVDMKTWYGVGNDGQIHRYFDNNAEGVHFSGNVSKESVSKDVLNQLGVKM